VSWYVPFSFSVLVERDFGWVFDLKGYVHSFSSTDNRDYAPIIGSNIVRGALGICQHFDKGIRRVRGGTS